MHGLRKGVDSYTFMTKPASSMDFSVPKNTQSITALYQMLTVNQQVDSSNIPGGLNFTGPYTWKALSKGGVIDSKSNQINTFTGNLKGGDMTDMMKMPSEILEADKEGAVAVSFGFYDSGPGWHVMTNQDQCYVYVTDSYETWMKTIGDEFKDMPFHRFALPGAHDAGMNTMATVKHILDSPQANSFTSLLLMLFQTLSKTITSSSHLEKAILFLAITQKDTFKTMLNLGIRYFDYRPGYLYGGIDSTDKTLYHQHAMIPGSSYLDFLVEVLEWLKDHESEIVVVNCNTAGFYDHDTMDPSVSDLNKVLADARQQAGVSASDVGTGDVSSLSKTYQQLIDNKTRLIFLNQIDNETTKYDSYSDSLYATLEPASVIKALSLMNKEEQQKYDYTVLQIQGTSTAAPGVIKYIIETILPFSSQASSPLMCTKGNFDHSTLPWLTANLNKNLSNNYLAVVLNDFADNATVSHCIKITRERNSQWVKNLEFKESNYLQAPYIDLQPVICPEGKMVAGIKNTLLGNRLAPSLYCCDMDGQNGEWVSNHFDSSKPYLVQDDVPYIDTTPIMLPANDSVVVGFAYVRNGNRISPNVQFKSSGGEEKWVNNVGRNTPDYFESPYQDTAPVESSTGTRVLNIQLYQKGNRMAFEILES